MKWFRNPCRRRREICLFAAGALPEQDRPEMERHLAACSVCRNYYNEIAAVAAPLANWEKDFAQIEPTQAMQTRWASAVQASAAQTPAPEPLTRLFHAWPPLRWVAQATRLSRPATRRPEPGVTDRSGDAGLLPKVAFGLPPGQWPGGTGESPVPPRNDKTSRLNFFRNVWRELIWPCRRAWIGMAAVWLALLAVNARLSDPRLAGARSTSDAAMMQSWEEQTRVLAELTQPGVVYAPANIPVAPSNPPRPRSERERTWQIV